MSDEPESKVDPIDRIRQYLEKELQLNDEASPTPAAAEGGQSDERKPNQVRIRNIGIFFNIRVDKIVCFINQGVEDSGLGGADRTLEERRIQEDCHHGRSWYFDL